ncbi:MAG: helix-turn-helix domain-containing protein [Candidatus Symbiothrix sp.]|jgi:hypothetical protein|nr:helix-turn-helix domain-containing protein [Candidatus Symbiothrix sp.]
MKENLYSLLVTHLLNHIPQNIKASYYLMDLLGLGRESIYRRIRGDIAFTAEEILKIADALNISIDAVIGGNHKVQNISPNLDLIESDEPARIFQASLAQLYDQLLSQEPKEIILAINSFHPVYFVGFDVLFKFSYYQWLYQNSEVPITQTFSEIYIPPKLDKLKEQIRTKMQQLDKSSIILDQNVFLNLIKDIKYYNQKKLITDKEKCLIKEEISGLIDFYEQMAKTGLYGMNNLSLFLSVYVSIISNMCLVQLNDTSQSVFRLHTLPHTIISNPQICEWQKIGFDFLKRQSICITQSNEIMQSEFFDLQRRNISQLFN